MRSFLIMLFMAILTMSHAQKSDAIHYTSLNAAINLGQYDGSQKASELKKFGNFGLGSEERLASELVMLDGIQYSIPASGKLTRMNPDAYIPFAAVKFFKTEKSVSFKKQFSFKQVQSILDSLIGPNRFAAIRITAKFSTITFRSFAEQKKPYHSLAQAEEVFFNHQNFTGTLVGFYTPQSAEVLNKPVYHFHVIDQKLTTGGHLVECMMEEAWIEIDYANQLIIDLPSSDKLEHINLDQETKKN